MRSLSLVIIAAAVAGCSGDTTPVRSATELFSPAELQGDVARMRAVLFEGHPALHKYRSPAQVDSLFNALADSAGRPMSAVEFWKLASIAVAGLRDDHTSVVPNDSIFKALYRDPGAALPMRLAVIDGRLHIIRNYLADGARLDGSEILEVNGTPATEFLAQCRDIVPTDGDVALRAVRKIERDFDLTCGLLNGMPSEYRLVVRTPSGESLPVTIPTMPWRQRRTLVRARAPEDTVVPPPGKLEFAHDSMVAILAIRTFDDSDEFDPGDFIDKSFDRIGDSPARSLIIDLRGNTGGADRPAAKLFAHIARDTFTYYTRREVNRKRFDLLVGTDDWTLNYLFLVIPKRKLPDGRYVLRMGMDKPMRPHGSAFKGPVHLLLDGNSVSTSSELGSVFRARDRGTIIGEESGSALTGGTGATVSVVLPNTQLILNLPLMTAYIAPRKGSTALPRRGVLPDVSVSPTLADLLARKDPALDSALTLARMGLR